MKAMLAAAALAAALVPAQGHAATLAECDGVAPSPGPGPLDRVLAGSCIVDFISGGLQTVTLRLEPGLDFVGPLQGTIHKLNTDTGLGFKALFAGPVLVLGVQEAVFTIDAGTWRLGVLAGHLPPCVTANTPPIEPCHRTVPAIGSFSGSVTNSA